MKQNRFHQASFVVLLRAEAGKHKRAFGMLLWKTSQAFRMAIICNCNDPPVRYFLGNSEIQIPLSHQLPLIR